MTDKALKGNKLTKRFHLYGTSLKIPQHLEDQKKWEIKYREVENRMKKRKLKEQEEAKK